MMNKKWIVSVVSVALLLTACGKDQEAQPQTNASAADDTRGEVYTLIFSELREVSPRKIYGILDKSSNLVAATSTWGAPKELVMEKTTFSEDCLQIALSVMASPKAMRLRMIVRAPYGGQFYQVVLSSAQCEAVAI